jgi:hypothetical protein
MLVTQGLPQWRYNIMENMVAVRDADGNKMMELNANGRSSRGEGANL